MKKKLTYRILCAIVLSVFLLINHYNAFSQCSPTTAKVDLDVNNVRTKIMNGGDMWWDLTDQKYEIPKGLGLHSMFSGALWIGGTDAGGNVKLAAQTYRQTGNDFWAGPVAPTGFAQNTLCTNYNQLWKINKQDVAAFISGSSATAAMISYPGVFNGQMFAPYFDANNDNVYNTAQGDYPYFDMSGVYPNGWNNYLHGDQSIWWVFNDVGNIHTETGGAQLGIEVRAEAFAYSTNTPLNNTTFYQYTLINQSDSAISNLYFGQFADPDLGNATDDFVGCDVMRNMGYCYNGDNFDDGASGYGSNPPAIGIKYLQGPLAIPNDGIDNNHNGVIDEPGEQILLSKFIYWDNITGPYGNPNGANNYYNYLKGIWGNGQVISHGDQGHTTGNPPCDFMYPGTTDVSFSGNWTEATVGNTPGDRRFLMSCGPFTMTPGQVQYITLAVVWARNSTNTGGVGPSVGELQNAADSVQNFFNVQYGSTGIAEHQQKITSTVYPNPFSESTTISIVNPLKEKLSCKIFDARGMLVRSIENISTNKIVINRNQLSSGLYCYMLESENQKVSAGKFVIE